MFQEVYLHSTYQGVPNESAGCHRMRSIGIDLLKVQLFRRINPNATATSSAMSRLTNEPSTNFLMSTTDDNSLASVLSSPAVTSLPLSPIADPFHGRKSWTRAVASPEGSVEREERLA